MKKLCSLLLSFSLFLSLSGCSLLNCLFSGCVDPDADLVVINDSTRVVGSLSLEYGHRTDAVTDAAGRALLEHGDRLGLSLEENCSAVTLRLMDPEGATLCRCLLEVEEGVRLCATLREDMTMDVNADHPAGENQ